MNKFLIGLLLCFSVQLQAQTVTVVDQKNGRPLEGVTLLNSQGSHFAITNAAGQASLAGFKTGDVLEVRMLGYATLRTSVAEIGNSGFKIDLERSDVELDQVVISASRRVERDKLVVNRIRRIDEKFIQLYTPQTAADLLGASGEVFIQKSQQGGGSPMIRGFATNRLLIAVDGVRMNNAIFRSGNLQNVISIDPLTVQSTEVVFGPGSVIYGSDAIGGVMSFQTFEPQYAYSDELIVKGSALTRFASANNEAAVHFDATVGGRKWSSVTSFSYTRFGDLRMGRHGPDEFLRLWSVERINDVDSKIDNTDPELQLNSGYEQTNFMQKVGFKASDHWNLTYALHYSATGNVDRYDRLIELRPNGLPRDAEWYYGPQVWLMNHLRASYSGSTAAFDQLSISAALQNFEESRNNRNFNSVNKQMRKEKVDAYSLNLDFTKALGSRALLTYGLEGVYNDVNSRGTGLNISTGETNAILSRYPQSTWGSYAAYAALRYQIAEKTYLHGGLRYNYFSLESKFDTTLAPVNYTETTLSNNAVTWSLGIMHQTEDDWWFGASASTGFRAPNVDDVGKFFDPPSGGIVVPNNSLTPEYATNFEASVAKRFSKRVKLELNAYYTLLSDAMVLRPFTLNGADSLDYDGETLRVFAIQNAAKATVYGMQATLDISLPHGFSFTSRFNYQKGEEELDNGETSPSRHAAPMFGKTRIGWSNELLTLEFGALYSAGVKHEDLAFEERTKVFIYAKDENGNTYSPSWYDLYARAIVNVNDVWQVSGGIENLTNQRYRTYSSGIAAPGRNIVLSLRARF